MSASLLSAIGSRMRRTAATFLFKEVGNCLSSVSSRPCCAQRVLLVVVLHDRHIPRHIILMVTSGGHLHFSVQTEIMQLAAQGNNKWPTIVSEVKLAPKYSPSLNEHSKCPFNGLARVRQPVIECIFPFTQAAPRIWGQQLQEYKINTYMHAKVTHTSVTYL